MFSGEPLPDTAADAPTPTSARCRSRAALEAGADVVITGRCVDSAVTLGALMHEFGWRADDYDLLAAGSLAGHIIECGCQATGGLHTDWEDVPDWAAHRLSDRRVPVPTAASSSPSPPGTGGLVNTRRGRPSRCSTRSATRAATCCRT